jgi:hypothetical protein
MNKVRRSQFPGPRPQVRAGGPAGCMRVLIITQQAECDRMCVCVFVQAGVFARRSTGEATDMTYGY